MVTVDDSIFIRGGKNELVKFTPAQNLWKKLPSPDLRKFQMVEVQGQLLIVEDAEYFSPIQTKFFFGMRAKRAGYGDIQSFPMYE